MFSAMRIAVRRLILATLLIAWKGWAGGSGLNVIVVVNQNSTNSVQLGNDYCEQRGVPPQNLFRMTGWTGGALQWSASDFETLLRQPAAGHDRQPRADQPGGVCAAVHGHPLPGNRDASMSHNSTTSALFYGFKPDAHRQLLGYPSCSLPDASSNSYAFSELPFQRGAARHGGHELVSGDDAHRQQPRRRGTHPRSGVASDSTFPTQTVYLAKTSDPARNVRFVEFDNAIFDSRIRGDNSLVWTQHGFHLVHQSPGPADGPGESVAAG